MKIMKKLYIILTLLFAVIVVNAQPGVFSLTSPANAAYTSTTPTFTWGISSGANTYQLWINGILKKDNISGTTYTLLPGEALTQSVYSWNVIAVDSAGTLQTASSVTWSIHVDATPPTTFNLTSPANNSWTTSLQPTFTWSASSDALSGLAKYQLWVDGNLNKDNISSSSTSIIPASNLSNGSHTWYIVSVDNVGNTRNSTQTYTVKIDNYAPNKGINYCLSFNNSNNIVTIPNNSNYNVPSPQKLTIEAWVKINSFSNYNVVLSKGAGCCSDMPYQFGVHTNQKVFFHCYQSYSGHDVYSNGIVPLNTWTHIAIVINGSNATFFINGISSGNVTVPNLPNCTQNITFGSEGNFPNGNPGPGFNGLIDEIRLWSIDRQSSDILYYHDQNLNGSETGLVGYWKFNEGSGTVAYDKSIYKNNGIISNATYVNSSLICLSDLCDLKQPTNSIYLSNPMTTFSWGKSFDAGIGFQKYQLWIDGSLNKDNLSDSSWTVTSPLAYGQHTWYVKGFDSLGNNQSSNSSVFYIDNAKPNTFNLISPKNDSVVGFPTPNLTWQATADSTGGSGLSKYQLWINSAKNRDSIPVSQTTTAPSTALPQGVYTWFVKAYDKLGNVRQSSQTWTFYVDWDPPTDFSLISPTDNQTVTISRPTFVWQHSSDLVSGLTKYELIISGYSAIALPPTDTTYTINFDLPNGSYTWYVKAYDLGGNTTVSLNTNTLNVSVPLPVKPTTPTGVTTLCYNPANSTFTIPKATYAASYVWSITPAGAGTITGTDTSAIVDWNNTYSGMAGISVKGHNTQGNGISSDTLHITIQPQVLAPTVTTPVSYCQNATATFLTATGNNLLWYTVSTGGTGSGTSPTPNTVNVGTTTFYVSQTVNGCESPRASISVVVNSIPTAPTVTSPVSDCQNVTANSLTATGSNLLWYTVLSGGTGSATAPTPNTTNTGTTTYYVSQTVSGCESPRASISVVINAIPTAPTITTPVSYCQNATATSLTATGSNLLWYTVSSGGTGSGTPPIPSTINAGTTTYYVSQTVNGCESPRASISIVVNATPTAPTVTSPVSYCQNATATSLTATGNNLLWYTVSSGGTGSGTSPTPSTVNVGTTTYYVSQTVNGCESPRASISVIINGNIVSVSISANPSGAISAGTSVTFTASPTNGGSTPIYQWKVNGSNVGSNSSSYTSSTLANGDIVICILTSNNSCVTGNPATSNALTMNVTDNLCGSWTVQSTGFAKANKAINSISIVNPNVVWAGAYNNISTNSYARDFTKTTNGGNTWKADSIIFTNSTAYGIANLCALNDTVCYAAMFPGTAANGGYVSKTINGGTTWSIANSPNYSTSWLDFVYFFDANNGICVGDPNTSHQFVIYTTTTAGASWTQVPVGNIPVANTSETGITNYFSAIKDTLWFGTSEGRIYKTINRGANWTVATTGLGTSAVVDPVFSSGSVGIALGFNNTSFAYLGMYKTTNGGTTWSAITPSGFFVKNPNLTYVPGTISNWVDVSAGTGKGSSYSVNDCNSFLNIDTGSVYYTYVKFYNNKTGWAGGINTSSTVGGIYKWTPCIQITATASASPNTICSGGSSTLNVVASGGTTYTYSWASSPAGFTSTAQNPTISPTANTTYTVTVTSGSNTATSSVFVTVNPNLPANINLTANPSGAICAGISVTFTANPTNGGSTPIYQWKVNSSNVGANSSSYTSSTLANGNTVTCVLTSNATCVSGSPVTSNAITMSVNPLPQTPIISEVGSDLQSNITTGNHWYYNNVIITGAISQVYTPTVTGNYYSIVTDGNGCISDTSNVIYIVITGIYNFSDNNCCFEIYPNPANDNITIENNSIANIKDVMISICNIQGKLLLQQPMLQTKVNIDVSSFAEGMYFIEMKTEKGIKVKKFIKE